MQYLSLPIIFSEFVSFIGDADTLCNFELAFANYPSMQTLHKLVMKHVVALNNDNTNIFDIARAESILKFNIGDAEIANLFCKKFTICDWSQSSSNATGAAGVAKLEFEQRWRNLALSFDISDFAFLCVMQKNLIRLDSVCNDFVSQDSVCLCVEEQMLRKLRNSNSYNYDNCDNCDNIENHDNSTFHAPHLLHPMHSLNSLHSEDSMNSSVENSPSPLGRISSSESESESECERLCRFKNDLFDSSLLCNNLTEKFLMNEKEQKLNKRKRILMRVRMQSSVQHKFKFEHFDGISKKFKKFLKNSFGKKHGRSVLHALRFQLLLSNMQNNDKKVEFFTLSAKYNGASNDFLYHPSHSSQDSVRCAQNGLGSVISIAMVVNNDLSHVCVLNYDGRWHFATNVNTLA